MMNQDAKEVLEGILKKDLHELTVEDKIFLKARRSYLNADQKKKYESVLEDKVENTREMELKKMNKPELVKMGKKLGVDTNVSKDELVSNILAVEEK